MEFSRKEYWSGLPHPLPGDLPNPGIEPRSPTLQADYLPSEPPGKPFSKGGPLAHTIYKDEIKFDDTPKFKSSLCNLEGKHRSQSCSQWITLTSIEHWPSGHHVFLVIPLLPCLQGSLLVLLLELPLLVNLQCWNPPIFVLSPVLFTVAAGDLIQSYASSITSLD